jgi:hypothetical protein
MSKFSKSLVYSAILSLAGGAAPRAFASTSPEIARTVDAFVGTWRLAAAQVLPGGESEKAQVELDCKKTALGKGVVCTMRGTFPRSGAWEGSFLVAFDTYGSKVHLMAITSDESVHDHVCAWKGDASIVCDPLRGGSGGQPVTEEVAFAFGPRTLTMKVVATLKDGGRVLFDATGKRR